MNPICLLIDIAIVLTGLLVVALLAYSLLRLMGALRRAYLTLFARPKPHALYRLHNTRRSAQQAMDDASDEFLDDIYRQAMHDWSHF